MEQISIITDTRGVHERLLEKISAEIGNEIAVETETNALSLISDNDSIKNKIVDTVSTIIIEEYENKLLSKLINQNYCYFNTPERRNIYKKAVNYVENDNDFITTLLSKRRSELISEKLNEYLQTTNQIILDGFINFRLKEYQNELEDIIDKAVDDFLVEKEYKEFIKLLKYFVAIQKPKHDVIHILAKKNRYHIYDEDKNEITSQCSKEFISDSKEEVINTDDLLISSLISISPRKIYIHKKENIKNIELLTTINSVFSKNVIVCSNCELCED